MRSGVEAVCEPGEHRLAGMALWHGGWDREPRRPLGQPQHRRAVGPPDDPPALPVGELGALVDDGRAQGDVGQPRAFRLVTGVAATPALLRIAELPHCRSPKFPSCEPGGELGLRLAHGGCPPVLLGAVVLLGAGAGDAEEVADFGP